MNFIRAFEKYGRENCRKSYNVGRIAFQNPSPEMTAQQVNAAANAWGDYLLHPRTIRTQMIIDSFKGLTNEWYMLKGVLMASHTLDSKQTRDFDQIVDCMLIAERMDALNGNMN